MAKSIGEDRQDPFLPSISLKNYSAQVWYEKSIQYACVSLVAGTGTITPQLLAVMIPPTFLFFAEGSLDLFLDGIRAHAACGSREDLRFSSFQLGTLGTAVDTRKKLS